MKIERRTFKNIPTVLLYERRLAEAAQKGCILCYHGLTASKDVWHHDLKEVVQHEFLVVGVDSVGHGERRYTDFDKRLSQTSPQFGKEFLNIVSETAKEVPLLIDELTQASLVGAGRVGMLGVSMGGLITYSAVMQEPRLKVAATIVSSPQWWMLDLPESPHHHIESFASIKLTSQTAGKDEVVPSRYARAFHEKLRATYHDYDERFAYYKYPESNHLMEPDWEQCWERAINWFEKHL
jgi:alpha-beta hydrolase superfamily lysophospholipase